MRNAAISLGLLGVVCALVPGTSPAQQRRPVPPATACNLASDSCRDDCTMDFGASIELRAKLGLCLEKCEATHRDCTERWTEVHRNELDPANFEASPTPLPAKEDEGRTRARAPDVAPAPVPESAPASETEPAAPPDDPPAPPSTRSRYSSAPAADDAVQPAEDDGIKLPSDEQLRDPQDGEHEAPLPAKKKQAETPKVREQAPPPRRDDLPPEPKEDISDWDPDGE